MPESFRNVWLLPCGIPGEVILDTGGEFFSDVRGEEFPLLGIRPNNKHEGSHAYAPVRSALLKICEENSQWDMDRVQVDVLKVVCNSLEGRRLFAESDCLGHGVLDVANVSLGEGDHHQNDDVLQDLSTRGPFIQPPRLREVAALEILTTSSTDACSQSKVQTRSGASR